MQQKEFASFSTVVLTTLNLKKYKILLQTIMTMLNVLLLALKYDKTNKQIQKDDKYKRTQVRSDPKRWALIHAKVSYSPKIKTLISFLTRSRDSTPCPIVYNICLQHLSATPVCSTCLRHLSYNICLRHLSITPVCMLHLSAKPVCSTCLRHLSTTPVWGTCL